MKTPNCFSAGPGPNGAAALLFSRTLLRMGCTSEIATMSSAAWRRLALAELVSVPSSAA